MPISHPAGRSFILLEDSQGGRIVNSRFEGRPLAVEAVGGGGLLLAGNEVVGGSLLEATDLDDLVAEDNIQL
jgi:hypothetical protein